MACRLARRAASADVGDEKGAACAADDDSDADARDPREPPPGWRKKANLRMYTILDKIF